MRLTSPTFEDGGWIPRENIVRGDDLSPELHLEGLDTEAVSIAITLDDASHPLFPDYNHWCIWNIPACESIPAALPAGAHIQSPFAAQQGMAYGRHRYKGPKPPLDKCHTYVFTAYVLDCMVELSSDSDRDALLEAMEGHILQQATLTCRNQRGKQ